MYNMMIFLHVTSALFLGIFLVLPFLAKRLTLLSGAALEGFVGLLLPISRSGHYALIVSLLTGGAMVSKTNFSTLWMTTAVVLLLITAATVGMMTKRMKRLKAALKEGKSTVEHARRIGIYSWVTAAAVLAALLVMTNPTLLS